MAVTQRSYVEGPRWAAFPTALRKLAVDIGVDIKVRSDKRLLRETVFFEVTGTPKMVKSFMDCLERGVGEWNDR